MEITVLIKGIHDMEEGEAGVDIYDHTGAVTLIQNGTKNILVDTGGRGRFPEIEKKLAEKGLKPDDIHVVILTHFHLDHAFNVAFFPKAQIIGWIHEWKDGRTFRFNNIETWSLAENIHILATPGHTPESLSVLVEMPDQKKLILCGDALSKDDLATKTTPALASDKKAYQKSADQILEMADWIIPGHGEIIHSK